MVLGEMKRAMSSMCPSVSSPWMPAGSQMNFLMPRLFDRIVSICFWVSCGFLFLLSRHCLVVRSVPLPLTSIEPPSRIRLWF